MCLQIHSCMVRLLLCGKRSRMYKIAVWCQYIAIAYLFDFNFGMQPLYTMVIYQLRKRTLVFKAPQLWHFDFHISCSCIILTHVSLESVGALLAASSLALQLSTVSLDICTSVLCMIYKVIQLVAHIQLNLINFAIYTIQ